MPFTLKGQTGSQITEYSLKEGVTSIGRSADNAIVLDDAQVSRHHAQIEFDGKTARITDLGSSNGTQVNGNKLEENVPRELQEGDSIGMGNYVFAVGPLPVATAAAAAMSPAEEPVPAAAVKKPGRMSTKALAGIIAGVIIVGAVAALALIPGALHSLIVERTAHIEIDTGGLEEIFEGLSIGGGDKEGTPTIVSFISSSRSIPPGESAELTWTVSDATEVSIEPGVGTFTGSGSTEVSPQATQTYILTATNEKGAVTRSITIEIAAGAEEPPDELPVINAFSASPTGISEGESSTLDWDVSGANSVSISPGASSVPASGSATSSPSGTTTYVLTATNEAGSVTESVTVTVTAAPTPPPPPSMPTILSFGADPPVTTAGSNIVLMWNVYGASSISIDNGIGQIPFSAGYIVVPALTNTTYTLTASNAAGSVSESAAVTVSAPSKPVVNSFTASPASISAGGVSTISWNVSGASSVTILPGGGAVASSGSATVSPGATTTFTLTATNAAGSTTRQATVTIAAAAPPSLPVIGSFTASPASIAAGGNSTLSWSTSGATSVSISPGGGAVAASGSATASPGTTTTYTLTATNAAGSTTRQVTVTVSAAPPSLPVIGSFTASPASITAGGSSTLSWSTSGATSISISPGGGAVAASGSATASPGTTTTYTLTASNAAGSVTDTVTVTVTPAGPPPPADATACEQALFNAVNSIRTSNGRAALTRNSYIDGLCRQHAQYMASAGTLSHDNFDTRSDQIMANVPGMMCSAENVLYNFTPCDAAAMAQQWYDSPGHRTNMLNADYTIAGMGIYIDGSGKIWACQIFAGP